MVTREFYFGRLKSEQVEPYEQLHHEIPNQILINLKAMGVTLLEISRADNHVVMMVEIDSSLRNESLMDEEAEQCWQLLTGVCFEDKWKPLHNIFHIAL